MPVANPFTTVVPDLTPAELWDAWLVIYAGDSFNKTKFLADPHAYVQNIIDVQTKVVKGNESNSHAVKRLKKTKAFYEKYWGQVYTNHGDVLTSDEALDKILPEDPTPTGGWDGKTWPPPPTADFMEILETIWNRLLMAENFIQTVHGSLMSTNSQLSGFKTTYNNHSHMQYQQYQTPPPTGGPNTLC